MLPLRTDIAETSVYEVYQDQDGSLTALTHEQPSENDDCPAECGESNDAKSREVLVNEMGGPEPEELIAWLVAGECPLDALRECVKWMEQMWQKQGLLVGDHLSVSPSGVARVVRFRLPVLKREWEELQAQDIRFPLAPVVKAWKERPQLIEPERRAKGIIPATFARRNDRLPFLNNPQPPALPGLVESEISQSHLPGLIPDRPPLPALLSLYDRAAAPLRRGRGAALSLRLFIESLLSLPVAARDGRLHELRFTIREVAGEWLGWNLKDYRPTGAQKGLALRRAVNEVRSMFVDMPQGGLYYPISPLAISGLKLDDQMALIVCLPSGSDVGPPVDRPILRQLGKISGPAYRAYLTLCCEWDRVGGHNGRLIRPTRPGVMRASGGQVVDGQGNVVHGKGERPIYSPYHPNAIRTGRSEANPARFNYREYSSDDLIGICYPAEVLIRDSDLRKYRHRARKAVIDIAGMGGCTIERLGSNPRNDGLPWRVMPPDPYWPPDVYSASQPGDSDHQALPVNALPAI